MKISRWFIILFVVFSCNQKKEHPGAIARVNDQYLYEDDLRNALPENYTPDDSIRFRINFINTWAKNQLLLQKAELNINTADEIDELVKKYRTELLIDRYKEALLMQKLDTVITESDIMDYYNNNKELYRLNEKLLQLKYIHIDKNLAKNKELIEQFKSNDSAAVHALEEEKLKFISSNLNDSIWVSFQDVKKMLPFLAKEKKLKKIKFLQKEDSLGVYLVAIKNVLDRNDIAPESYVEPLIRKMILHKRKLELIKDIEKTLLEDATQKKEFETY